MRKNKSLISVIMPVYNGERFISEAIDSILDQTYKRFELIIVNDASTDNTDRIISAYKKRFSTKIKVLQLDTRIGAFGAANKALAVAKGAFIAPMDSDDIAQPTRLEKEVAYLERNRDVIVVGSWARLINADGTVIGKKTFSQEHEAIKRQFFEVHPIVHPSCMVRRNSLPLRDKLYAERFGVNDDYFTFFTLLPKGKFANIPEFLLDYRIHGNNSSLQHLKEKFFNTVRVRLCAVKECGYQPTILSWLKLVFQIGLVFLIPETLFFTLYLMVKGIYTPKEILGKITGRAAHTYKYVRNYSFALLGYELQ